MDKRIKYAAISLILLAFCAKTVLAFFNEGAWWDEAVYLSLGNGILNGYYSLNPHAPLETFRPPLFPLIAAPFSGSLPAARFFVILLSILAVGSVYLLARKLIGKDAALWASLFVSANQLFVFFSAKALSEPLFISLFSFSLLFMAKRHENEYYALASGLVAGLAFLTRYLGSILIGSIVVYFLFLLADGSERKENSKAFTFFMSGIILALIPWALLSFLYYGNIIGSYAFNFEVYSEFSTPLFDRVAGIWQILGIQLAFSALGLYFMLKGIRKKTPVVKNAGLVSIMLILPIMTILVIPYVEARYLLSFIAVYAIFAGIGLQGKAGKKTLLQVAAIIVCVFYVISGLFMMWNDRLAAIGLVQASEYLKDITSESDTVMSESYPYVYYFSQRTALVFPIKPDGIDAYIMENNITYVLLYKFEPKNPSYTGDYFDANSGFKLVKSFAEWGDPEAVRIYKVIR